MERYPPTSQNYCNGFITLEILIAMTILISVISATTLLSFGANQIFTSGEVNRDAVGVAEAMVDTAKARARKDFKSLISVATTTDGDYRVSLEVNTIDHFYKEVTALVSWKGNYREEYVSFVRRITDYTNTSSEDTCDSIIQGDWKSPNLVNNITSFATLVGSSTGVYPITDLDVYDKRLYVTASNSSVSQDTFFIFNVSDQANPTLISSLDNDVLSNTGIKALFVHKTAYETLAYVANGSSFTRGQLQIIDASSTPPRVITTYKIPTSIVTGTSNQGNGNSIFYKDGYVYLGLTKTVTGPEFNIIDVHDPRNPYWVGGYSVGNGVNGIYIRDTFAYVVSPNSEELIVLDISDKANPIRVSGFDAPDSVGSGKSISLVGDQLYLGRTATASHPELYIVDAYNSISIPSIPLGTREVGSSVNGLVVRSNLLFMTTTSGQFQVVDVASSTASVSYGSPILLPNSGSGGAIDCEGNTIFVASNPNTGIFANKGSLSIITAH